ncbi:MAG TPA: hypothetical protein VGJ99_00555 [Actinomycetota bacterium]
METHDGLTSPLEPRDRTDHVSVGPDLPSVWGLLVGSLLFLAGGILMLTVIAIPFGILLFAAGLGLMLEPTRRDTR